MAKGLEGPVRGVLVDKKVVVFDRLRTRISTSTKGFYGKFYAISKPKTPNVERELELSLLDALYLVEKGKLEVEDASGSKVSPETLRQLGRETYENFDEVYAVYRDLQDKGLVEKSGMKFGATFVVYRLGPGLEHAPFLVHVLPYNMPTYARARR
jgi:tRNA-intron endonuclease